MGFLSNLIGTGSGLFIAFAGWLIMDLGLLLTHKWLRKAGDVIVVFGSVLMLFGGELTVGTGVGTWIVSGLHWAGSIIGGIFQGVLALLALYLLIHTIRTIKAKHKFTAGAHAMVFLAPIVFGMFTFGAFASINHALQQPAVAVQARVDSWMGVS